MTEKFVLKLNRFWDRRKPCPYCKTGELMPYSKGKVKFGYEYCISCNAEVRVDTGQYRIKC